MLPVTLSDEQWQKMRPILRAHPNAYVGQEQECRRFLSAVLWMARSGAQWRLLPKEYGYWNTIYRRFARWSEQGIFHELHQALADDADMQHLLIDSTIIRAHPCAAGARKKSGGQEAQALGRSRGGFSTKIHIAVDALGNPLRLLLTAGQRHDSPQAGRLIENFEPQALIADKGYDSDTLIESVTSKGILAVIPPKKSRLVQRQYDEHLYRERHLIECFINKIKHYRRVFSRFDKLSKNYLGFLSFVSALVWLR